MRFFADGPSIPDALLWRCDAGRVVFLCGAGVSIPSKMPTFFELTKHVVDFFDPAMDSEIMTAFQPWIDDPSNKQSAIKTPLDQVFNLLHQEYGKEEVNTLVTERLQASNSDPSLGIQHRLIKRISVRQPGIPQIVTTNFDRLFELEDSDLAIHIPPAFPDLSLGATLDGITYLHGRLTDTGQHAYVLSSADFGRAYLSEAWATKFIRSLLEHFTVVLVGYQAEDPPVKYLLQGLNHDGQFDRSRLYAFDKGRAEDIEAKWRDRGVTSIAYEDHDHLWQTFAAWAERADDPRSWRASIIYKAQQDPKDLAPHERGQVTHVLRTAQGAKLFSEAKPPAHPEWVCVMDTYIRSAKQSSEGAENPTAYGLDDDLRIISEDDLIQEVRNDHLLAWRHDDDNPHESYQLDRRQTEGFETTPKRLIHLINWISKSIDSPVIAWWAARKNGLHPRLLHQIEWQVRGSKTLSNHARHVWNLILEHHRDPRNFQWNGKWFDLKQRIKSEGWTGSVLRDFYKATAPRLGIKPPYGERRSIPPCLHWEELQLDDLGKFEVVFLERHNENLDVPDEALLQVFSILMKHLGTASQLLDDIQTIYFQAPTCYQDSEIDEDSYFSETSRFMLWIIQLFDRVAAKWPELAQAHATIWPTNERYFFRKLKLYAFSKSNVFNADYVAQKILSLDQQVFWSTDLARELLFLLVGRWQDLPEPCRYKLTERILKGPDQFDYWPDEQFSVRCNETAASYARYLELQGCELATDHHKKLDTIISSLPEWNDGWAISTVTEWGRSHVGYISRDEKPDVLLNLPAYEVVPKAKEELKRDFDSFTDKRPFTGLVKANPRKALSALTIAGRAGDYPQELWAPMIDDLPEDISSRLKRVFLKRVAQLPHSVIAELRHTLSRWLSKNLVTTLELNHDLGWMVYDHIVDGILSGGENATKSGIGVTRLRGKIIQPSRRTYSHAINGPVGMCAEALLLAVADEKQEAKSLIPNHIKSRIERLFVAPGEGADHAVSVVCRELNWLMFIDPDWTESNLISMLSFEHSFAEPAWNGFLHSRQPPQPPLAKVIKPLLLDLFPRIESYSWGRDFPALAAQWLGFMRVFRPNEPSGLSQKEMRSVLRFMSDDTRNQFIFWLGRVGQKNEDGWVRHVIPLVNDDWPRERRYRTTGSVRAWVGMLDDTGDHFPEVYEAVKKFLVPVETDSHSLYQFIHEFRNEKPICTKHPETTLDLINRITPQTLSRLPSELQQVLALIAETKPELTSDPRYLRLIDLVEAS